MPRLEYTRTDLVLTFRPHQGLVQVEASFGAARGKLVVDGAGAVIPGKTLERVFGGPIEAWAAAARQAQRDTHITRVLLRVEDRDLAGRPWERLVPGLVDAFGPPGYAVVRDVPVPPRAAANPWTLPLRIVHDNVYGYRGARDAVEESLGAIDPEQRAFAVRVFNDSYVAARPWSWTPTEDWPTAEVIHLWPLHHHPAFNLGPMIGRNPPAPFSLTQTLRVLGRTTEAAQTRLVVIDAENEEDAGLARVVGSALAARGGPATLVLRRTVWGYDTTDPAYIAFYDLLIHDRPLDWIARELQGRGEQYHGPADVSATLIAGAGREEALRVSGPGLRLIELADRLETGDEAAEADLRRAIVSAKRPDRVQGSPRIRTVTRREVTEDMVDLRGTLGRMKSEWQDLAFERHESAGLIPYAAEVARMRTRVRGTTEAGLEIHGVTPSIKSLAVVVDLNDDSFFTPKEGDEWLGPRPSPELAPSAEPDEPPQAAPPPRWVVPSLADAESRSDIAQAGARLTIGSTYHLGIRIGERDERTRVVGAVGLFDEVLKLRPEDEGAWIEVGVTGIGFDVLGEPVQELWMPRGAASDTISFAVVPRDDTVAVLRYTLYHRGSAVQSYRLAAATVPTPASPPGDAREALARALEMTPDDVGGDGWLARMEFSLVADPAAMETRPPRAVSIIANDVAGKPVITVKGGDCFDVWFPGNVGPQVQRVRALLDQVATTRQGDTATYNFGRDDGASPPAASPAADSGAGSLADEHLNEGDEATLKTALKTLAEAGWDLYTQLISGPQRQTLSGVLEAGDGQTIQVAHVLLEKVLPWSLLYDRPFTPNAQVDAQGNPLKVDACLAALPGPDGTPSPVKCGQRPCILASGDPGLTPETVACPRHFWGFRHVVEVPPQQVPPGGQPAPQVDEVKSAKPASLLSGFNKHLPRAQSHSTRLEKLEQVVSGRAKWADPGREFQGEFLVHRLNAPDVDLVYLYCHARGGAADPTVSPCLEFVGLQDQPNRVAPGDLASGAAWAHHPLVILNGCGTVGFSPDALSPFLPILVRDRGAAGVLGTEISVWEQLAGEFAEHFLSAFLAGRTAGQALLEARRKLLAQRNPLGLAYTLYASADLHFAP